MTNLKMKNYKRKKIFENSILMEHKRAAVMLQEFGLSKNETAIYITLLEAGRELGGSDIAKKAGIPRQYIYIAIPLLCARGLIIKIPHGKKSRYKAVFQGEIEKIAKRKLVEAETIVHELSAFSHLSYEQDFEVVQGDDAIRRFEMENVEKMKVGDTEYIIGGATDGFSKVMGNIMNHYLNSKQRKNIKVKYIGNQDEELYYKKFIGVYLNQEYRFIENLPQGVAHMVVRKDSVSFYTFLNPPLIYIVKASSVAENYKQFFLMLWNMAEKK